MDHGLAAFLHFRSVTLSPGYALDAYTLFKELKIPHRRKRLKKQSPPC